MGTLDDDMSANPRPSQSIEENDPNDDLPDFRFLAALSKTGSQIPKRGEKDFEPHGTRHQEGILETSRQAMHVALSHTRIHAQKTYNRGFYYGDEGLKRDEVVKPEWRQGLEDDHIVVMESWKGPHFKSMGKMIQGQKNACLWLLPEEALFLVERGNLDLWWPTRSSFTGMVGDDEDSQKQSKSDDPLEQDEGAPMSLQAAYAVFLGKDGEHGKVSLERYTIYANLRRDGHIVLRAPGWDPAKRGENKSHRVIPPSKAEASPSIFTLLFGRLFSEKKVEHPPHGPLVKPGMYRSYNAIYRQIAIIQRHQPSTIPAEPALPAEDPYRVVYHLWAASRIGSFAKSNPGLPDYRVAIVDARASSVPTLTQITSLLASTPLAPPPSTAEWKGSLKTYQRLKHGWRNVVLAINDQGVVSYMRLGEAAFGEEKLYDRFDQGGSQGSKRGRGALRGKGTAGGGRGRGRGRGRGFR